MEYADLKGKKVDMIGFGTYKIGNGEVEKAVETALETGYKRIDTAVMYANEEGIGRAINKRGVKREDLFITTKLWTDVKTPEDVRKSVYGSLERLKTDYIDMLLIHWPTEYKNEGSRVLSRVESVGDTPVFSEYGNGRILPEERYRLRSMESACKGSCFK